ncbi:MAG: 2-amino-4-hydroxy-6-hydroxymethyldihydropteridine diphosphokinase [Bacteroidales bacterium]|nr:2-amino-4-hydroxy-6-hydroxymethyldihydropteridine diphosphokinase [Bacteroidales bacterium]
MSEKVYFSLGSNLGDREANLVEAIRKMDERLGSAHMRISSFMETPSWGFDGPPFINCAVEYMLDRDPFDVLDECKAIEREMGRDDGPASDAEGRRIYHSRLIDIDIIRFGERRISSPRLTVPHPLAEERDFVRIPMSEIFESN